MLYCRCGEVCSHIAAILFKVEACVRLKIATRTCTDLPCVWNQHTQKRWVSVFFMSRTSIINSLMQVQPSEVVDVYFFKPNRKRSSKEAQVDAHLAEKWHRSTLAEPKARLCPDFVLNDLHECFPKAAVFSIIPDFIQSQPTTSRISNAARSRSIATVTTSSSKATVATSSNTATISESWSTTTVPVSSTAAADPSSPQPLTDLYDPKSKALSTPGLEQACTCARNRIRVTHNEADFLGKSTVSQSKCLTWYEHRKGWITASYFYAVSRHIASSSRTYPITSITQYSGNIDHVPALRWGRENEDRAREAYTTRIQLEHQGVCTPCCGLVVNPKYPFLGVSPDGILSCTWTLFRHYSGKNQMCLQVSRSTPDIRYLNKRLTVLLKMKSSW